MGQSKSDTLSLLKIFSSYNSLSEICHGRFYLRICDAFFVVNFVILENGVMPWPRHHHSCARQHKHYFRNAKSHSTCKSC